MAKKTCGRAKYIIGFMAICSIVLPAIALVLFLPKADGFVEGRQYVQSPLTEAEVAQSNRHKPSPKERGNFSSLHIKERHFTERNNKPQCFATKRINYSYFRINEPNFINNVDRTLFLSEPQNVDQLQERQEDVLTGIIEVIPNGSVNQYLDCGWRTNSSHFRYRPKHPRDHYAVLCPLLVPSSYRFQHFIDGVLPKLMQLRSIVASFPEMTYLLYRPTDGSIYDMLYHINISIDSVAFYNGGDVTSDYLINTCITPPLHPALFSEARKMLVSGDEDIGKITDGIVILLTRNGKRERRMHNREQLISFLREKYGINLYVFRGDLTFSDSVKLFRKARIVLGVHGGAFYHIISAPSSAHIVEIMPTTRGGKVKPSYLAHTIFWSISNMLSQTYWRINSLPTDTHGNLYVDVGKVAKVLEMIELGTIET